MGSTSWAGWLGGVKDLALTDEQLAQRDLTRTDPEVVRRFGKGTAYNLKARAGSAGSAPQLCRESLQRKRGACVSRRAALAAQIVIKGDLATGKSSLLKRLRGGGFSPTHVPRRVETRRHAPPPPHQLTAPTAPK